MSSLISNMIARLGLDSADFERGAQRSRQSMYGMTAGMYGIQSSLVRLGAAYFSARGILHALASATRAAMENEAADRRLAAAMRVMGDHREGMLNDLRKQAEQLARVTVYSNDEIETQMALARSSGIASEEIGKLTRAGAGLAAMYGKDLPEGMRILINARQGETGGLQRLGIVLKDTMSATEKYHELMRRGQQGLQMAQAETETLAGAMTTLKNVWQDTKAELVAPIVPPLTEVLSRLRDTMKLLREAKEMTARMEPRQARENAIAEYRQRVGRLDPDAFKEKFYPGGFGGGVGPQSPKYPQLWDQIYQMNLQTAQRERTKAETEIAYTQAVAESRPIVIPDDKEAKKNMVDIAAAYRAMYGDLGRMTEASFAARARMLDKEYEEYKAAIDAQGSDYEHYIEDKAALDEWYDQKRRRLQIDQDKAGNDYLKGMRAGIADLKDSLGGFGQLGYDMAQEGIDGIADSLADAAVEARNFGDAMRQVGQDMARMGIRWAAQQLLTTALTSLLPGPKAPGVGPTGAPAGDFNVPASRLGNIFDRRGIVPFARGGVVNRPTLFPFARGTGLMGESGPEAIMPLQRDRSGNLGVRSSGAGGSGRTDQLLIGILRAIQQQQLTANVAVVRSEDEILGALRTRRGRQNIMQIVQESQ